MKTPFSVTAGQRIGTGTAPPRQVVITDEIRHQVMEFADAYRDADPAAAQEHRARLEAYIYRLQTFPPHLHLELLLGLFLRKPPEDDE